MFLYRRRDTTSSPWPRGSGLLLPTPAPATSPSSHLGVRLGLLGLSDLDWLINGLDGSQLVRLQKCRLLVWGRRCKEKHPAASVPTPSPPQPTQESQTLGKLTLGWRRGEGKPLAKPSEIFLLLSLLFRFCLCPPPIPRPEFFGSASNPRRPHGFSRSHYSQWGCKDFQIKVKDFSLWRKHEGRGGRLEGGGGVRACQAMWEPSRNARSWIRVLLSFQVSKTWRKGGPIQTTAGGFTQKCCTFPALHLSDSFS